MEAVPTDTFDFEDDGDAVEDLTMQRVPAAYALVESVPFQAVFGVAILANTAILATNHHGMDPALETLLTVCNVFFTILFTAELVFKLVCRGTQKHGTHDLSTIFSIPDNLL